MANYLRYALATVCFAASVGCLSRVPIAAFANGELQIPNENIPNCDHRIAADVRRVLRKLRRQ
jgi:hypothetical protein